jgi:hypothetical protein
MLQFLLRLPKYLIMKKPYTLFLFLFCLFNSAMSQTASIKVFSEINNTSIFLDEVYKGEGNVQITNLSAGSYYLKAMLNNTLIYSEVVILKEDESVIVLIKNSKEIQDKILSTKFKEQEEYRMKKLDVLRDVKYITQTTENSKVSGQTNSMYFPGYYSVLGLSGTTQNTQTQTTSETRAVTNWFIVEGNKQISHLEFSRITGHEVVLNAYKDYELKREQELKKNMKKAKASRLTMFVLGGILSGGGFLMADPFTSFDEKETGGRVLFAGGAVIGIMGISFLAVSTFSSTQSFNTFGLPSFESPLTIDDAILYARTYNRKLKAELGLPDDFEPVEK